MDLDLTVSDISFIMGTQNYGVCYEPIKDAMDLKTIGYEALSRFKYKGYLIPPNRFFMALHNDEDFFFYTETVLKQFQIEQRIKDKLLFLNLDPDVSKKHEQIEFWAELLSNQKDIVIEIIENMEDEDLKDLDNFMKWLDFYGLTYAYDDFLKPNQLFFKSLLENSSCIKLDMNFIQTIRDDSAYIEFLKGAVKYAHLKGKKTILEGVENEEDLDVAQDVGVDYVQGYLFKEEFITLWKNK